MYKITDNDVRMFYELYSRFDKTSPYIAVIGDKEKFERVIKDITRQFEGKRCRILRGINTLRIMTHDNIEFSYMQVKTLDDLIGKYFRKFI